MSLTPEEAAEQFGSVRRDNFLAHTIRDIEHFILRNKGRLYQIQTYTSESPHFKCHFFNNGCAVQMAADLDRIQISEIRLRLAHELGHIVNKLDNLPSAECPQRQLNEQEKIADEIASWKFAYFLIRKKSQEYDENKYKKLVFPETELAGIIQGRVKDMNPEISNELRKVMPFTD